MNDMRKLMEQLDKIDISGNEFESIYSDLEDLVYDFNTSAAPGYLIENLESLLVKYGKYGS